jgi:hypothetical protein
MVTYVSGMPPIILDEDGLLSMLQQDAIRSATHVTTDPVTGVIEVSVYHDDGFGNGKCILSFPLAELQALAADYRRREAAQ